jgi:hypothetical protein
LLLHANPLDPLHRIVACVDNAGRGGGLCFEASLYFESWTPFALTVIVIVDMGVDEGYDIDEDEQCSECQMTSSNTLGKTMHF